jgi:hypothetical protein
MLDPFYHVLHPLGHRAKEFVWRKGLFIMTGMLRKKKKTDDRGKLWIVDFVEDTSKWLGVPDLRRESEHPLGEINHAWEKRSPAGEYRATWKESFPTNVLEFSIDKRKYFFQSRFDNLSHVMA